MSREIKNLLIEDVQRRIGDARDMLVVDCSRLDAVTTNRFRLALQDSNIRALTVKNSIARIALERLDVKGLDDEILSGPSTLVWGGDDIVALSKEITKWAKELKDLAIKGGTVEGEKLDQNAVEALSKSPGRAELIGQIAGLMLAPGRQLAGAMQAPGGLLAGCLKKIAGDED